MEKNPTTKLVLWGNAALLIIGTISQSIDTPFHNLIMSTLFVAWVAMLVWHMRSPQINQE
jgi:hypothetical protein